MPRSYDRIPLAMPKEAPKGAAVYAVLCDDVSYGAKLQLARKAKDLVQQLGKIQGMDSQNEERRKAAAFKLASLTHQATLLHLVSHIHCFEGDFSHYAPGFPAEADWPDWSEPGAEKRRVTFLQRLYDEDIDALYAHYKGLAGLSEQEADDLGKS